jgi:hypothetical protein
MSRLKIIRAHFHGQKINKMKPFTEMDLNVWPHAIAWMARDDTFIISMCIGIGFYGLCHHYWRRHRLS